MHSLLWVESTPAITAGSRERGALRSISPTATRGDALARGEARPGAFHPTFRPTRAVGRTIRTSQRTAADQSKFTTLLSQRMVPWLTRWFDPICERVVRRWGEKSSGGQDLEQTQATHLYWLMSGRNSLDTPTDAQVSMQVGRAKSSSKRSRHLRLR